MPRRQIWTLRSINDNNEPWQSDNWRRKLHQLQVQPQDQGQIPSLRMFQDEEMDPRHQVQPGLEADRMMNDPEHFPMPPPDPATLFRHPLFNQARRKQA